MSTAAAAMTQKLMEMKKKEKKKAKTFEIDLIEEAGILVTVKAKPNPKLGGVVERSSEEMHMVEPCGGSNSRIIRLSNVVEEYGFTDDEDYEDFCIDMTEDGEKVGKLVKVVVPRPNQDHHLALAPPGVGKVFFEFADMDSASRAISAYNGKPGPDNFVVAEFYPENMYALGYLDA